MYALNIKKGTTIRNEDVGILEGGVAIPINEKQSLIAKHLYNVVVFDRVAGINEEKAIKGMYGIEKQQSIRNKEFKTYQDFVSEHKDVKIASQKWDEYKKEVGSNE
jgi:hypothetical protein